MKKKEQLALKTMILAGLLAVLGPIGKLWGEGTLPAMLTAACLTVVVAAGIYCVFVAED